MSSDTHIVFALKTQRSINKHTILINLSRERLTLYSQTSLKMSLSIPYEGLTVYRVSDVPFKMFKPIYERARRKTMFDQIITEMSEEKK